MSATGMLIAALTMTAGILAFLLGRWSGWSDGSAQMQERWAKHMGVDFTMCDRAVYLLRNDLQPTSSDKFGPHGNLLWSPKQYLLWVLSCGFTHDEIGISREELVRYI